MMKRMKPISTTLIASALLLALVACQKQEGPAEHAGKAVDNAAEKAGQKIEQAGKDIQDSAKGDKK
jgi:hypothetical protein